MPRLVRTRPHRYFILPTEQSLKPVITVINPSNGAANDVILVQGVRFTGITGITFDGAPALFVFNSDNQLTVTVPAGTGLVPVVVTTPEGASNALFFNYGTGWDNNAGWNVLTWS